MTGFELMYLVYLYVVGVRMDEPKLNIPLLNSVKPPYTLDSTKRIDYQQPQVRVDLKNNTTKYGCNSLKHIPATGAGK